MDEIRKMVAKAFKIGDTTMRSDEMALLKIPTMMNSLETIFLELLSYLDENMYDFPPEVVRSLLELCNHFEALLITYTGVKDMNTVTPFLVAYVEYEKKLIDVGKLLICDE